MLALLWLVASGCAELQPRRESPDSVARMKAAADGYLACISGEAEKEMKNAVGAEDIATAAHGRCWTAWEAYRKATASNFSYGARTREEIQYAQDRTEAHVREFEREARRGIVDTIVQRSLKAGQSRP